MPPVDVKQRLRQAEVFFRDDLDGEGSFLAQLARGLVARRRMSEDWLGPLESLGEANAPDLRDLGHSIGVMRVPEVEGAMRVPVLVEAPSKASDGAEVLFVWVLLGTELDDEFLEPFGWMLADDLFGAEAVSASHTDELLDVYLRYLEHCFNPESGEHELPPELQKSDRFLGGLINDVKRRLPHYGSDFTDGLNTKSIASVLFLYFACLAPAVAFGGLLSVLTEGQVGAVEMIVATAICGTVYALFAGQPLTILGSTGPVVIFMGILYELTSSFGVDYFHAYAWVGLWTMLILVLLALFEVSRMVRFFTRFTDEIFAGLIALIFIVEALKDTFKGFFDSDIPHDTALLSLLLAFGTYMVANQLSRFRRSPFLVRRVREFLADFGPAIAICVMTGVAFALHPVALEKLDVPDTVRTTTGRDWFVNPLEAPSWVIAAAIIPALLVSVLLYLDQNITVRLVNSKDNKLKKGAGYHLDLLMVGLLVGVCSLLGLPWMVAATVRSLNHVRSLADVEVHAGREVITSVQENRLSALLVHLLVAASLLLLVYLAEIPMSVLFGLFLYMGVGSMRGNQLFDRMKLWWMDPAQYPPTHYVRRVEKWTIHKFTAIQTSCLAVLWVVKVSAIGILFPLFIALLVPVRFAMGRIFSPRDLAFLDAEEDPEDEMDQLLD